MPPLARVLFLARRPRWRSCLHLRVGPLCVFLFLFLFRFLFFFGLGSYASDAPTCGMPVEESYPLLGGPDGVHAPLTRWALVRFSFSFSISFSFLFWIRLL